jgi:hypothetical protein
VGSGSFGAWFPAQPSKSTVLWCCCRFRRTKSWAIVVPWPNLLHGLQGA